MQVAAAPRLAEAGDPAGARVAAIGVGDGRAARAVPSTTGPSPAVSALPAVLTAAVTQLGAALDVLLAADLDDLAGEGMTQLVTALQQASERAAAGVTTALPRLESEGWWALGDEGTFPRWAARRLGMSVPSAKRRLRLGRALIDHLPATAAAARAGRIGNEAANTLAAAASSAPRREVLADPAHPCNEGFLLAQAAVLPVDDLRAVARVWASHADPESDERGYREASDREHLTLARLPYGYRRDGQLTAEHGQQLRAALAAVMPVPAADDTRSIAQRRAQGLSDLARTVLEHHRVAPGRVARPGVMVHVDHATLAGLVDDACRRDAADPAPGAPSGPPSGRDVPRPRASWPSVARAGHAFTPDDLRRGAFFDDGTPVSRDVLDRLACDGELSRILFSPAGEVLDLGRAKRLFSGPVRAAVTARDGCCAFPGCGAPPHLGEVHHIAHWACDGGETEPGNGVLLCYHHHDLVHRRALTMRRRDGAWEIVDRFGTVLRR